MTDYKILELKFPSSTNGWTYFQRFSGELENIFNKTFLVQMTIISIALCMELYQLIMVSSKFFTLILINNIFF